MRGFARAAASLLLLLAAWQGFVWATRPPPFMLPDPLRVAQAALRTWPTLLDATGITLAEIVLGLLTGIAAGVLLALALAAVRPLRLWLLPALVVSQALPVFALAPLLVLWLGYGMAPKVAMAALLIFFPVAVTFLDGLRRVDPALLDLARTMAPDTGWATRARRLWQVELPAALPALASGIRMGAGVAPIAVVIGEWVGASRGLGYLMLHANGRAQTDVMFAALACLALLSLALYFGIDAALRRALPWLPDDRAQPIPPLER
ncbi:ABC transporter permease [Zavarzinia sp. CC-PAN008]|uniref:ABC transporter permease n=1 Tax=Zavarzinia sp. CC-PAN008 TaxID=3243332 RepID=UPI003F743883